LGLLEDADITDYAEDGEDAVTAPAADVPWDAPIAAAADDPWRRVPDELMRLT